MNRFGINPEFEALLRLTQRALFGVREEGSDDIFRALDWEKTLRLSGRLAVTAITFPAVEKLPADCKPPLGVLLAWGLSERRCHDEYAARHRTLASIRKVLSEDGIDRVLLLKGETLSALYPVPESRASGDIDIMPLEKFEESNLAFERRGATVDRSNTKHSEFLFEGIDIENHTPEVHPRYHRCDYRTELLVQKAAEEGRLIARPDGYLELDPVTQSIYTLNHFALHIYQNEEVTLRMAADLELLLQRYPSILRDWAGGIRFAGLGRFAKVVLCMLDILFGEGRAPFMKEESGDGSKVEGDALSLIHLYMLGEGSKAGRLLIKYRYLPRTGFEQLKDLAKKALRIAGKAVGIVKKAPGDEGKSAEDAESEVSDKKA